MAKSEYLVTLNGYKIKDAEAIQSLSVNGKTITITKRDGSTDTITTQDTNTTYSAGTGLSLSSTTFNHSNSVTAATNVGGNTAETPAYGATFAVPYFSYDAQGHITGSGTKTVTIPASDKVTVNNTLTSTSTTQALSAAQGKALNDAKAPLASPALTGTPTAPTAAVGTNTTQIATTAFVQAALGNLADAMIFKGVVSKAADLPATHEAGWTYKVATAGTYAGFKCEVGDMIICITDGTTANNAHWTVVQTNIDGAVTGPATATAGNIAVFGANGQIIADGGIAVPSDAVFTDTTYSAGTGLSLSGTTINHSNSVTAGSNVGNNSTTALTYGGTFVVPKISYDAQGHITSTGTVTLTLPASDNTDTSVTAAANHYTPTTVAGSALTASSGTATDLATASSAVNVFVGLSRDDKGHVTGGTYKALSVGTMGAATASAAGKKGLVPAPAAGDQAKFLTGAGTWVSPTSYSTMTGATDSAAGASGLVPAPTAASNTKFLRGDATWASIGLEITDDGAGNISFGIVTD